MIETILQGLKADGIEVSISKLCTWLGLPRRTFYYRETRAKARRRIPACSKNARKPSERGANSGNGRAENPESRLQDDDCKRLFCGGWGQNRTADTRIFSGIFPENPSVAICNINVKSCGCAHISAINRSQAHPTFVISDRKMPEAEAARTV